MKESLEARIARYLSGEMTGQEKEKFNQELASDPGLKEKYLVLHRIWQNIPNESDVDWDVESAFNRFSTSQTPPVQERFRISKSTIYLAVAATVLVIFGTYAIFFKSGTPVIYAYQEGATTPIVLPDGSKIYLNKSSDVAVYPFTRKKRYVDLHGEAYFEVNPDANRHFVVASGETITEVEGTSFNIDQAPGYTRIFVNTGRVIFSSRDDSQIAVALNQGESAVFEEKKMQIIPNPSQNIRAWHTRQLQFGNMSVSEIVEDISDYFDQEIIIQNEAIRACRLSTTMSFKDPEISKVLTAVALAINANLLKEGQKYILKGGGCS